MDLTLSFQKYFTRLNRDLISIGDFTKYLKNFQKIIYIIANEKGYKKEIKDFRFLIKEIQFGSCECVVESYKISKDLLGEDPIDRVIDDFETISKLIEQSEEENKAFQIITEKIKGYNNRLLLYSSFEEIIPLEDKAFQIYRKDKKDPQAKRIFLSRPRYKKRINAWRELDKKPETKQKSFVGIIKTLSAYHENKKYVRIIDQKGNSMQYFYKDDERDKFTKFYDSDIIKITGTYDPYRKTITEIVQMDPLNEIEFTSLMDFKFKIPLKIKLEHAQGAIYGSNEEYGLFAMGSTYDEMINDLYKRIDATIDLYLNPEIQFTEASQEYRKKFIDLVSKVK